MMNLKNGFLPAARKDAEALILGSLPGEESLKRNEYYGNPRNSFWRIMASLFNFDLDLNYKKKIEILKDNRIALWDVLKTCERCGSLDMNIRCSTIIENNFLLFFQKFPLIRNVYFNGAKAEHEYHKRVEPRLPAMTYSLNYHRLSSTSPAMARLSHDAKLGEWSIIKNMLLKQRFCY